MPSFVQAALAVVAVLSPLVFPPASSAAETLRINGTGSGLVVVKPLTAAFQKENRGCVVVMEKSLGSSAAIKAVSRNALDLAVSSRPLKPAESVEGLVQQEWGRTPMAVLANRGVRASGVTLKELAAMYAGSSAKWPGGELVRVVLRPVEDTDTKLTRSLSPEMDRGGAAAHARKDMLVGITDNETFDSVKKTEGAVAVMALTLALSEPNAVSVLKLDGVQPSVATLATGRYRHLKEMYLVTRKDAPASVTKFIKFLYSKKGRAVAAKHGLLITEAK
ncbi:substrate-binding domain-containing protein [Geomonas nitrogeniifigens]|uniref:PstS family phosphate ABC transporter substrate-binding protein n=1 Tax=Geomonas diazotrophica TaxID=2843197 RepID=UPI001C2B847A|nr:substrate-binding domain-containing protein [Geomonas nitrogeniifigens]QXE87228.1 substrate-binding domain-containing protein [Geomonas nitrogeniifigens]